MTFDVRYDEENDCVIGSITGSIDKDTVKAFAKEVAKFIAEHNCRRFLNDLSGAKVDLSTMEIYNLPDTIEESGIERQWRRAIVVSDDLQDYSFFENVSANLGYPVRVFSNFDEALNWLKGKVGPGQ